MKFGSLVLSFVLFISVTTSKVSAELIQLNLANDLRGTNENFSHIEKVIISKVKRRDVLKKDEISYSKEVAYFFHKIGFSNIPVSFLAFEDGKVINLNANWQPRHFTNNLNKGVLFMLLVYSNEFDFKKFNNALENFKIHFLKENIKFTLLENTEDVLFQDFHIETIGEDPGIRFISINDNFGIKELFINLDFKSKPANDLKVGLYDVPPETDPAKEYMIKVKLKNNSNYQQIFSKAMPLKFEFQKESKFFINEKWVNNKTAKLLNNELLKPGEEKTLEFYIRTPLEPGTFVEDLKVKLGNIEIAGQKLQIKNKNTGLQLVKVRSSGNTFIPILNEPSVSGSEIGRAPTGHVYVYKELKGGFYKIEFNGKHGWVNSKLIDKLN